MLYFIITLYEIQLKLLLIDLFHFFSYLILKKHDRNPILLLRYFIIMQMVFLWKCVKTFNVEKKFEE